jgi:hypothetical protein
VLLGSLIVVLYLGSHLRRLLTDMCGTEERAGFWTAFSKIILVLLPLICALFPRPSGGSRTEAFFEISHQLQWGLIGLAGAVVALGLVLSRSAPCDRRPQTTP